METINRYLNSALSKVNRLYWHPLSPRARASHKFLSNFYPAYRKATEFQKCAGLWTIMQALKKYQVEGPIVECGVGMGNSLLVMASYARFFGIHEKIYAFDSFQGFPEPTEEDRSMRNPRKGDLWANTSVEHITNHFAEGELSDFFKRQVQLVPGFFEDTLPGTKFNKISFLNLDVDLYSSYKVCMRLLGPQVQGLILYDEFESPKWPGATKAIKEDLPALKHHVFKSRLLDRIYSIPENMANSEFAEDLAANLEASRIHI